MSSSGTLEQVIQRSEEAIRLDTGIVWDCNLSIPRPRKYQPDDRNRPRKNTSTIVPNNPGDALDAQPHPDAVARLSQTIAATNGAQYLYDGSLEGMLSAIHQAFCAHDTTADILCGNSVQPRIGQECIEVTTSMDAALKVRRSIEYAHGSQAFKSIRAAAASDQPDKGTIIYRFIQHALACTQRRECKTCPSKLSCTKACNTPTHSALLEDASSAAVFDLVKLYREVMNERHLMAQFIRFEHCEGDVWFARCNPKASVVPLLMDWFVPRFNDQRFVIFDENHGISGVFDGRNWYLVAGDTITPPKHSSDEAVMQKAWRRFYASVSVEARFNPELRRNFMPMRLWQNLTELQETSEGAPLRGSIRE